MALPPFDCCARHRHGRRGTRANSATGASKLGERLREATVQAVAVARGQEYQDDNHNDKGRRIPVPCWIGSGCLLLVIVLTVVIPLAIVLPSSSANDGEATSTGSQSNNLRTSPTPSPSQSKVIQATLRPTAVLKPSMSPTSFPTFRPSPAPKNLDCDGARTLELDVPRFFDDNSESGCSW